MLLRGIDRQIVALEGLVLDVHNVGTIQNPEMWLIARPPGDTREQDPADWELLVDLPDDLDGIKVLDEIARLYEAGRRVVDVHAIVAEMIRDQDDAAETKEMRA